MDLLAAHAARQPDQPALVEGDRTVTWADYIALRNRLAHALAALPVRPGERVVVYALNSIEYLLAVNGIRAAGALPVPMNTHLVAEEVAYIVADSEAVALFAGDSFVPVAEQVRGDCHALRHVVLMGRERRPWAHALDALLAAGSPDPLALEEPAGASMLYTGGTTGRPKGAIRGPVDPATILPRLAAFGLAEPGHVHLVAGPLYHSAPGGFAFFTQLFGGTCVILPRFDPEAALVAIARHRCSSTFMAPTLLKRLVDLPADVLARHDVSSMRVIVVAGAPCPMTVKEKVVAHFGPVLYEFYGSTELGIDTILLPADVLRKPGSCGRAAPGVELAILDDEGRPVATGTPGQLFVRRTADTFRGYHGKPEALREMERGDWVSVGDVAYVDEEGFVYICDRRRDMIISGGVNIYPAEIEDVLHRHPAVFDVAVFGVPDDDWGERVHAAIKVRPGARLDADGVRAFARRHLAGYKVPADVSFHDDFPRDAAGKCLKRLLRDPYWAGRGTRI